MKSISVLAAALVASAVFAVSAGSAEAANTCRKACDKTYGQCTKAERTTCLPAWHKCKKACAPLAARTPQTPKPVAPSRTHGSPRTGTGG